jgi:uncharacterized OsmC-like protein
MCIIVDALRFLDSNSAWEGIMRLVLEGETHVRLEMTGSGLDIIPEGAALSPAHLLAGSLATCTAVTVEPWAEATGTDLMGLVISVRWVLEPGRPKRITSLEMDLHWPALPPERIETAERLVDLCTIHATLVEGANIFVRISSS